MMNRTWCFCEFAGGARSDLQPKILEEQLVQTVRRASYKCVRSAPGEIVVAELELAAVTSLFLDWSSVVAWAQTFPAVVIPRTPPLPLEREIRSEAKHKLKQKKQLKFFMIQSGYYPKK